MKKAKKITVISAVVLVVIGLIISIFALISINFDFATLNTIHSANNTYTVDESFNNIFVDDVECDINIMISDDDKCHIICVEEEKITHSVTVQNNTLTVKRVDKRNWYECIRFFYWENMRIDVYLPETEYKELYIKSTSGDIEIPENFTFGKTELYSTSGDIIFSAKVNDNFSVKTTSGNINLSSIKSKGQLNLESTSGDINISDVKCQNISAETTSGNNKFLNLITKNNMQIKSVSGDVYLEHSDAGEIYIKTTSGNVLGTLLTDKIFNTSTTSGSISIPKSDIGGNCEIITISGNINLAVE